jgi:thiol:disulfide interchange protein
MIEDSLRRAAATRWPHAVSPWIHLGLVMAGVAWWVASVIMYGTWDSNPGDANIASGFAFLGIAALGLPWSMLMFLDRSYYGLPEVGVVLILTGCALLNVAIHATYMARRHRRRTSTESTTQRA